jgi:heptosyltransferase-2
VKVAIVKPDHLGDVVLSAPAIRAIAEKHGESVLYIAPKNMALAAYLFPGLEVRPITLAHLAKSGGGQMSTVPDFRPFDCVAVLRNDAVVGGDWIGMRARNYIMPRDTHFDHQSLIDYSVAFYLVGDYDIDAHFFGARRDRVFAKVSRPPKRVGFSIGSGFYANTWPIARWSELARFLLDRGLEISLLSGPAERDKAAFIVKRLGSPAGIRVEVGGDDIKQFIDTVDGLDLVFASDGGTAHLCSLATPLISIFGPSPFRRYAPYGRLNRLLTRDLSCSPCCQYAQALVNGCLTTECMIGIDRKHIEAALDVYLDAESQARKLAATGDVSVYIGVSHLDREAKLAAFRREFDERHDATPSPRIRRRAGRS